MFGERLRTLRKEKNYTQEELGAKLDVSGKTIGTWERETREPSIKKINQIAGLFNVSTDYLLGKSNLKQAVPCKKDIDITDDNVVMTYEGKVIPQSDLNVMFRFLKGGQNK